MILQVNIIKGLERSPSTEEVIVLTACESKVGEAPGWIERAPQCI